MTYTTAVNLVFGKTTLPVLMHLFILLTNFHLQLIAMRPLQGFSKISLKHLIPLTIKSYLALFTKVQKCGIHLLDQLLIHLII